MTFSWIYTIYNLNLATIENNYNLATIENNYNIATIEYNYNIATIEYNHAIAAFHVVSNTVPYIHNLLRQAVAKRMLPSLPRIGVATVGLQPSLQLFPLTTPTSPTITAIKSTPSFCRWFGSCRNLHQSVTLCSTPSTTTSRLVGEVEPGDSSDKLLYNEDVDGRVGLAIRV